MSNESRRQHGLAVIAAYERLPGVETRDDGAPLVQVVTDLLTDLATPSSPTTLRRLSASPRCTTRQNCPWSYGNEASERRLLLACARLLLCVAQRQSVTLGQIKRVDYHRPLLAIMPNWAPRSFNWVFWKPDFALPERNVRNLKQIDRLHLHARPPAKSCLAPLA
jgi:hypothetical protein